MRNSYDIKPYSGQDVLNDYAKEELYKRAKKRLNRLKGFYWHLAVYLIINICLISLIGLKSEQGFWQFSTFSTAIFWGIGLGFDAFSVFGMNVFFGKEWEDRKIREYMDKDKHSWE